MPEARRTTLTIAAQAHVFVGLDLREVYASWLDSRSYPASLMPARTYRLQPSGLGNLHAGVAKPRSGCDSRRVSTVSSQGAGSAGELLVGLVWTVGHAHGIVRGRPETFTSGSSRRPVAFSSGQSLFAGENDCSTSDITQISRTSWRVTMSVPHVFGQPLVLLAMDYGMRCGGSLPTRRPVARP